MVYRENTDNIKATITSFTKLEAWRQAHQLVLLIYKVSKVFPSEEKFGLIDQVRRAAVSISSNIGEGFTRQGKKEKIQFYFTAKASLTEVENQLLIARDLHYLKTNEFEELAQLCVLVGKLLTGLIKSIRNR